MTTEKVNISLYQQAKAGLNSLIIQTSLVSLGLTAMLILTGGNPPGWMVSTSFFLGIGFVAWSEQKRQSELEVSEIKKAEKSRLVKAIKSQRQSEQNLQNADLAGADLESANLVRAILLDADLSGTILETANVQKAIFVNSYGINEELKLDLIKREAVFQDTT